MSFITHTDKSILDLSDDPEVVELIENRRELSAIEKEGFNAANKRREIDRKIIARLGNANKAIVGDHMIAVRSVIKPEHTVRGSAYKMLIVL